MSTDYAALADELGPLDATFDHVAHAAPRLRDLLPIYVDLLGGTVLFGVDNPRVGFRLVHIGYTSGPKVELLEPLEGSTFFDSFFRRTGGVGGLHHVTFTVADIHVAVAHMEARGYRTVGLWTEDEVQQEVFMHPTEAVGVLLQLVHQGKKFEAPVPTLEEILAGHAPQGNGVPSP